MGVSRGDPPGDPPGGVPQGISPSGLRNTPLVKSPISGNLKECSAYQVLGRTRPVWCVHYWLPRLVREYKRAGDRENDSDSDIEEAPPPFVDWTSFNLLIGAVIAANAVV